MPNSINSLSPDFRDFLLNRNIITDTIKNNGLEALLVGIGYPVEISVQPESVQASNDIEIDGESHQESNLIVNKYKGTDLDHRKVNIIYNPTNYKNFESYLDVNGKLNFGGPATQVLDIIGDITGFDAATTLINRTLVSVGIESDSQLGTLGAEFLKQSILSNIAFNIKDETLGRVNLNPLSLANGGDIIIPTYSITVPTGENGQTVDLLERMTGFETPVSLLTTSIFTFDEKSFIGVSNIDRANSMIANTGKGQVLALFANMETNTNPNLIGKRNGYTPGYTDSRISDGENTEGGTNANIYAYSDNNGGVIDLLNSNTPDSPNYPVANSNHNLSKSINNSGFNESPNEGVYEYGEDGSKVDKYIWGDKKNNKPGDRIFTTDKFTEKKSLLYKTQEMFKSNNIRTLTSGKAVVNGEKSEIQSAVRGEGGFISKGSGVLSETTLLGRTTLDENLDEESVFCRTWTTFDRYNQIYDLQKHSGLNKKGRTNTKQDTLESVLEDTGLVRIGPYKTDKFPDDIKKYMFSIENLAWHGEQTKLLPSEKGLGDLLTGRKGRIMWFPPYNISFNESVSVSWDKADFIGRGEPIYTYNNTERTGSLSWQIVVDHPNYMNYFPSEWKDDEIAAFFAGCLEMEDIVDVILTDEEKDKLEVAQNTNYVEKIDDEIPGKLDIDFYFPNDNYTFPYDGYENGFQNLFGLTSINVLPGSGSEINYSNNPTGAPYGLGVTTGQLIVSSNETSFVDLTNFGLNGWNNPIKKIGDIDIDNGVYDKNFASALTKYFKNKCKYCKIKITGYASKHRNEGKNKKTNLTKNEELSVKRANSVADWFKTNVLPNDNTPNRYEIKGKGELLVDGKCVGIDGQDRESCKRARKVTVVIEYDSTLKPPTDIASKEDPESNSQTLRAPISRFFTEAHYFEKLEQEDKFAYDTVKEKIKYFHPGFHSMTPEGFNSRLNFLHQCTRQGTTTNSDGNPDNLAFGRPPVCILRLGDFYHTKIIIDSLTIDYDPLVWDLNPEGVGVQPMIANVTISFAFIGGSSLKGPINRLQNAVSFNFYANSEIYDPRSEKIKIKTLEVPVIGVINTGAEIVPGEFPDSPSEGVLGNTFKTISDQEAEAEAEAKAEAEADALEAAQALAAAQENDEKILAGIKIQDYDIPDNDIEDFEISLTIDPEADTKFALTKEYVGKLFIVGSKTNAVTNIGDITLSPNTIGEDSGNSILISTNISQTIIEGSGSLVLDIKVFNGVDLITKSKKTEILINNKLVQDFQAEYYTLTLKWTDEFKSNKTYSE